MYSDNDSLLYYIGVYNENYPMPPMPDGVAEGIINGIYKLRSVEGPGDQSQRPQLFGSGPILREVERAQAILNDKYGMGSDVWSVTSYTLLARDAAAAQRWNRLHPQEEPRKGYLATVLDGVQGPVIASSDNVRLVADQVREWIPGSFTVLGTDGFGRSDSRENLRRHFEIGAENIVLATLEALSAQGLFDKTQLSRVLDDLGLDPNKDDPVTA